MYSDVYRLISFKLGLMIETTKLSLPCGVSFDDIDLHTLSRLYEKSKTSVHFLTNLSIDLD